MTAGLIFIWRCSSDMNKNRNLKTNAAKREIKVKKENRNKTRSSKRRRLRKNNDNRMVQDSEVGLVVKEVSNRVKIK